MEKAQNRLKPTLSVRLVGKGITPESVPVRAMSELIAAVQKLAGSSLMLSKVQNKSAGYLLSCISPEVVSRRLQKAGLAIKDPEENLEAAMLASMDEISSILAKFDCDLEIKDLEEGWSWTLENEQWPEIKSSYLISDESAIFGKLLRVGGAGETKCALRVTFQNRPFICHLVSQDLARKLGPHLYKNINARGTATYFSKDWKLLKFHIEQFEVRHTRSFDEMYQAMRKIAGDAIDSIENVDEYVKGLR